MKIKAFYLSAVAAIVTGLVSCDNAELKYDDVTGPGRLFLNEAVGTAKSVSFVIPDDGSVYTVTPRISKPLGRDLKLTVYVDEKASTSTTNRTTPPTHCFPTPTTNSKAAR